MIISQMIALKLLAGASSIEAVVIVNRVHRLKFSSDSQLTTFESDSQSTRFSSDSASITMTCVAEPTEINFLLLEDGFNVLLEDGGKVKLE